MTTTDHDMLIKLDTKMSMFCKQLTAFQTENQNQHNELKELITKNNDDLHSRVDTKLDSNYFRWVFRTIVGILIIGTIFTTSNIVTYNDRFKDIESQICILHSDKTLTFPIINQP